MLILRRKNGESIHVGDAVLTVFRVAEGSCKIGIAAPPGTKIMRSEILQSDQTTLIAPEDKRLNSVIGRIRSMSETARRQLIAQLVREYCSPQSIG